MPKPILTIAITLVLGASVASAKAPAVVPYIDAHAHVSAQVGVEEEVAIFRKAGFAGFSVLSPEAENLDAFRKAAPGYAIPIIGLARLPENKGMHLGDGTARTMAGLVAAGRACGFGEFPTHIMPATEPDDRALVAPNRLAIYAEANRLGLPMTLHIDISSPAIEASVDRIARDYPRARIILAHTGLSASPEIIDRLLSAHRNLHADLSLRFDPVSGLQQLAQSRQATQPGQAGAIGAFAILSNDGLVRPEWRGVMTRHADRFLFGTDLSDSGTIRPLIGLLAAARTALSALGPKVENAIAHGNYERVTASCRVGLRKGR